MRRIFAVLAVLILVLAACGGGDAGSPAPTSASIGDSASPAGSVAPGDAAAPAGPAAPDFELALVGGGSFSPSAEEKPVYLVFWAEW